MAHTTIRCGISLNQNDFQNHVHYIFYFVEGSRGFGVRVRDQREAQVRAERATPNENTRQPMRVVLRAPTQRSSRLHRPHTHHTLTSCGLASIQP
jgi:hypothetical protein